MRTLLALTALMLVLAAAVWWKTRPAEADSDRVPPVTVADERMGVVTLGLKDGTAASAQDAAFASSEPTTGPQEGNLETAPPDQSEEESDPVPAVEEEPAMETAPVATPPVPAAPVTHVVVSGDTLYGLVRKAYGTAPEELIDLVADANGLDDPGALEVGQQLSFPEVLGFRAPTKP